jgi:hypothetical protein
MRRLARASVTSGSCIVFASFHEKKTPSKVALSAFASVHQSEGAEATGRPRSSTPFGAIGNQRSALSSPPHTRAG